MTPKEGEILFVQLGPDQIIPSKAENKNVLRLLHHTADKVRRSPISD